MNIENNQISENSENPVMQLFTKHFGAAFVVNTNHPNIEAFLSDLNDICLHEDKKIVIKDLDDPDSVE